MRKQLCLVPVLLLAIADVAMACCSGCTPSVEELYPRASNVFVGRLVRLEEVEGGGASETPAAKRMLEATIQVVEVFKGQPPIDGKILVAPTECGRPLSLVAHEYVFFLNDVKLIRSQDEAMIVENLPDDDLNGERRRLFEKLRDLAKKDRK